MKKTVVALVLCAACACPAMGASSNDENIRIINTNHIDALIVKRNEALEGNYPLKRKCQQANEIQELMENFIGNGLDQYNTDRIIRSRQYLINYCFGIRP